MKELEKIIKLLDLSCSDHDGEALNAIRKANAMRLKSGLQWEELFYKAGESYELPSSIIPPVQVRTPPPRYVTVESMFREILNRSLNDMQRAKIEELRYSYEFCESLSGEEANFLFNTYHGNSY